MSKNVRHIILWDLIDNPDKSIKRDNAKRIKRELEGLLGVINGLKSVYVQIDNLESSSADIMLNCLFENENALKEYQVNPAHIKAATFVRNVTCNRKCIDFEE